MSGAPDTAGAPPEGNGDDGGSGRLLRAAYNGLLVPAARLALPAAARAKPKLRAGIAARRDALERWRRAARQAGGRTPRFWLHAASAGETLQARPLAEALRRARPEAAIFFSWFSPSAEPAARAWELPDAADYLPFDRPRLMRNVLEILAPDALILVGAEMWPNLIWAAAGRRVALAQACARLVGSMRLRWPVRSLARELYRHFAAVAAVAPEDAAALRTLGVDVAAIAVAGDTRVDATLARRDAASGEPFPWPRPEGAGPVIVAGSTWPSDEAILLEALAMLRETHPRLVMVVAPHEPSEKALLRLESRARAGGQLPARLGSLASNPPSGAAPDVVLVDRVGVLYRLYAAADLAWVGGGFGGAVHNTMEPAAWGVPVAIGPDHGHPHEVRVLARSGGLEVVPSTRRLVRLWSRWLADPAERTRVGGSARAALEDAGGAAGRTLELFRDRGLPL